MKKLKFLSIAMMLVLGFSSCSEDGPSMGDIQENLEGSWFCVYAERSCSVEGKYSCSWDFDEQTRPSEDSDGDLWYSMKLIVEATDDTERFYITSYYYNGNWSLYEMFDCINSADYISIAEDNKTIFSGDYGEDYNSTIYIEKLTKNELVIVEKHTEKGEESHIDKYVYKFRRIVEED